MKIQSRDALLAGQEYGKPGVNITVVATHHSEDSLFGEHIPPRIPDSESIAKMVGEAFQQTRAEQQADLGQLREALLQAPPPDKELQILCLRLGPTGVGSQAGAAHVR